MSEPVSNESSMTIAVAIAVALHAVPLLLVDPEEETIVVMEDISCHQGCFGGEPSEPSSEGFGGDWDQENTRLLFEEQPDESTTMRLDHESSTRRILSREQAIEQARIGGIGSFRDNVGVVGVLGSVYFPLTEPTKVPLRSFDDEFYLEIGDCKWCWFSYRERWRVREFPQLSPGMRQPATPPMVMISPLASAGGIEKSAIRRYLKRRSTALASCYETKPSLRLGPRARTVDELVIIAQFLIDSSGHVTHVTVTGAPTTELADCVERTIASIRFPHALDGGNTQVNAPLRYGTTSTSAGVFVR